MAESRQQNALRTVEEAFYEVAEVCDEAEELPPGNTEQRNDHMSLFNISLKHVLSGFHERLAGIQWRQDGDSRKEILKNNKTVVIVTRSFLLTATVVPIVHPVFESWNNRPRASLRGRPIPPDVIGLPDNTALLRLSDIFLKTSPELNEKAYSRITPSGKELGEFIVFDGWHVYFQALDGDWVMDWNVGTPRPIQLEGHEGNFRVIQNHAEVRFIFGLG